MPCSVMFARCHQISIYEWCKRLSKIFIISSPSSRVRRIITSYYNVREIYDHKRVIIDIETDAGANFILIARRSGDFPADFDATDLISTVALLIQNNKSGSRVRGACLSIETITIVEMK